MAKTKAQLEQEVRALKRRLVILEAAVVAATKMVNDPPRAESPEWDRLSQLLRR